MHSHPIICGMPLFLGELRLSIATCSSSYDALTIMMSRQGLLARMTTPNVAINVNNGVASFLSCGRTTGSSWSLVHQEHTHVMRWPSNNIVYGM